MKILLALGLTLLSLNANAALRPFSTDGCTDFPEGTSANPTLWAKCCTLHDLSYWAGGDKAAFKTTDLALKDCVAATGQRAIAEMMYLGVRLGHLSPHGIRGMQWGNAWSETLRRDTKLSGDEIDQLEAEISKPAYDSVLEVSDKSAFIQNLRETN